MIPPQQIAIAAGVAGVVLGVPIGLYLLLTKGQRRTIREIRKGATAFGWRYRLRRWQGNPAAFRIDGRMRSGLDWVLTSGNTSGYDRGWSVKLALRIQALGGEADFAVLPRNDAGQAPLGRGVPAGMASSEAAVNGAVASDLMFFRDAQEVPSGLAAFDAAYRVLALPRLFAKPPLDPALAERVVHWPAGATAPHSIQAGRDPFGFEIQARLPEPPNWAAVSYFVSLAEDLCTRLPAAVTPSSPATLVDRLVRRMRR
jgi:hypothetical protein